MTAEKAPGTQGSTSRNLKALGERMRGCRECPLGKIGTQVVGGEGARKSRLMLVGEAPGDHEDIQGRPFVGPAGRLLDTALERLGCSRETVYVTNAVKHFKFELRGKRRIHKTPAQREIDACHHWLEEEIELLRPEAAIALGATAAASLMDRAVAVTRERGKWLKRPDGLPVLVTLHPSAILRLRGTEREQAFERWLEDLAKAKEKFDEGPDEGAPEPI